MTARAAQLAPELRGLPRSPIPADARCIVYVRVSTERQATGDKISPDEQRAACATLARECGYAVDHIICQAHPRPVAAPGLIVCYDLSRWGRFEDAGQAEMFLQLLARVGWVLESAKERRTGDKDADLFLRTAYSISASKYRADLKRRSHDFMLRYAKEDQRWMGRSPFGYRRDPTTRKLVLGTERDQRTVRRIFTRYSEGATLRSIAHELRDDHVPGPFDVHTPRPAKDGTISKKWRPCTVRAILSNQAYIGTYRWHRRANGPTCEDPRKVRADQDDWVLVEKSHPALIDRATWDAVQRRLHRPGKRQRVRGTTAYLLTGLGKHARCNAELVGGGGRPPNKFYRCSGCGSHDEQSTERRLTVNQALLETTVVEKVAGHVATLVKSGALAKTLDRLLGVGDTARAGRNALERERRDLEAQQTAIVDAIADRTIKKEVAKPKLGAIEKGLARIERDVQELRLEPSRTEQRAKRDRLLALAADFSKRVRRAPAPLARELLSYWLVGFVVHDAQRKGAELRIDVTMRQVPEQLAKAKPARPDPARRCWRAGCRRSFPR